MNIDVIVRYFWFVIFLILILDNEQIICSRNIQSEPKAKNYDNSTKTYKTQEISTFESRIINGVPAKIEGNEHIVSLRWIKIEDSLGVGKGHFCGGSLIAVNKIVTAAHCTFSHHGSKFQPEQLLAVMGILKVFDSKHAQIRNIETIVAHKQYSASTTENDIALIFLSEPFNLTISVKTIEYATDADYSDGQVARVAGWGVPEKSRAASQTLLTANVNIVNRYTCKKLYYSADIYITSSMICAGGRGKDLCTGDSGGSLIMNNILYGIASFGVDCGKFPGVYTDVASYKEWIATNSGNKIIWDTSLLLLILMQQFYSSI